jgi:membrane-associated phospholipid phosphatase
MRRLFATLLMLMCGSMYRPLQGQGTSTRPLDIVQPKGCPSGLSGFASDFIHDEENIWTSPLRINRGDVEWLAPIGAGAAALFATDHTISGAARADTSLRGPSNFISNLGQYTPFAVPAALLVFGAVTKDPHAHETGRLAAEAELNTEVVVQVLKFITNRQRPNMSNNQSFPSGHAASAFALASVVASEYHDKPLVVVGAYGFATGVGLARIGGLNHFPSDVLAGAVIGELIGRYVVHHHDARYSTSPC